MSQATNTCYRRYGSEHPTSLLVRVPKSPHCAHSVLIFPFVWVHYSVALADLQGDNVEFCLYKRQGPEGHNQYEWQLTDQHTVLALPLCVSYNGRGDSVQLHDQAGALMSAVDLCRNKYYTVIKFSWNKKTYRYSVRLQCC